MASRISQAEPESVWNATSDFYTRRSMDTGQDRRDAVVSALLVVGATSVNENGEKFRSTMETDIH